MVLLFVLSARFALASEKNLERDLKISFISLGPADVGGDGAASGFVASLDAREGISANLLKDSPGSWHKMPDGVENCDWARLIRVGFGTRRDWLALQFDAKEGAVSLAAHRPAITENPADLRRDRIPPGRTQISSNAVKELAAEFAHVLEQVDESPERPIVSLKVETWAGHDASPDGEESMPGLGAARSVDKRDRAGVLALALGAAWRAGWAPTLSDAPTTFSLKLARGVRTFNIRAVLKSQKRTAQYTVREVADTDLFPHLVRLFMQARQNKGIGNFLRMADSPVAPLMFSDGKLVTGAGGEIFAFDITAKKTLWRIEKPRRHTPSFPVGKRPSGERVVCRVYRGLHRVADDGRLHRLSKQSPTHSWSFAPTADGVVIAAGESLSFYRGGEKTWQIEADAPLDAGPCVGENRVGVATLRGKAMCYRLDDGAEIWHKDLDCHPGGPMGGIGEAFLLGSREGFLVALSEKDGHEIWRADIGGILLTRPLEVKGGVLVASRSNRLFVFDPAGKKMGEYSARSWPLHVEAVGNEGHSMVACAELSGTVSFLKVPDLHPVRRITLPARPAGLLFAGRMTPTWGEAGAQLLEERPVLAVSDQEGFVYFIDVAAETTTERTE